MDNTSFPACVDRASVFMTTLTPSNPALEILSLDRCTTQSWRILGVSSGPQPIVGLVGPQQGASSVSEYVVEFLERTG